MKTQLKKSISLFLAVLMVLSCWVWVAPQEAEAGNISATNYKVEINFTISKKNYDGGNIQYKTSGNGWGTQSSKQIFINSFEAEGCRNQGTYTKSFTTTDFPSYISVTCTGGGGIITKARMEVNWIKINGKQVWTGSAGFSGANSCEIYPNNDAGNSGNWSGTYNWPKPMIQGFTEASASGKTNPINLTLNKIGGQNVSGATSYDLSKYTFYDQYGKQIADGATFFSNNRFSGEIATTTHVAGTENSDEATENTDIWVDPNNADGVVVSPNLQISNPQGSDGKSEYYLVKTYKVKDSWGGEQTSKVSAKINVTYPKYTVNFNAGLSSASIIAGDTTYTGTYSPSNYHGGTIALPSATTAEGYTFYEYWSKPQPASGDASYNALEAKFAKPCSTEDYTAYKGMEGSTVEGDIVTDTDGNRWYDAGKKLDPTTVKTIDVSDNYAKFTENWYGWWLSKDISVKFYDVDGTFFKEKVVKGGQTGSDIEWPTSKYIDTGYTSGSFYYKIDNNNWVGIDGEKVNKNSYTFGHDLILTPAFSSSSFKDTYTITFIDQNTGKSIYADTGYGYRTNVTPPPPTQMDVPNVIKDDLPYSYTFEGWSSVEPINGRYHVILEDADFDVNGTAIGINKDWIVRNDATYYAVYRRHVKSYAVNFKFTDSTGTEATRKVTVKYGDKLTAPTEYVPYSYATGGFGYTFNKWGYKGENNVDATLGYAESVVFTSKNVYITGAALEDGDDVEPIEFTATYGEGVPTPYTVTFIYKNEAGEDVIKTAEVKHEKYITQETVDSLAPATEYDNGEALVTYTGSWAVKEGAAEHDAYETEDLTSFSPTSHITFEAVYGNPRPFYTVTYIDGSLTYSERVLDGVTLPAWTNKVMNDNGTPDDTSDDFEEDVVYLPSMADDEKGSYEFQGWFDEKQTDETYNVTNGNKYDASSKVTSNLTLYPQFKFKPYTYVIKFMSYDGKVQLAAGEFQYGHSIEMITAEANRAAQTREQDDTYTYMFLGWDQPVPTFCEGKDMTFIAQYKPVYRYYDAKWYNSKLEDGKWVADKATSTVDGEEVETYLLATTHHTYDSKLYAPSVDNLACKETPTDENKIYVFAGWYYNDAEGNAVKYERGMKITGNMEFYAVYAETDLPVTLTTVVRGEKTEYTVAHGAVAVIPEPQAGYVDEDKHDAFDGWYTDADCTIAFDIDSEKITADTTIYAKFTEDKHEFTNKQLKTAPTYYAEGENEVWCSCDQTQTTKTEKIPVLTDEVAPTGTIYLGTLGSWSSTDAVGAAATDGDEVTLFANADTNVIITTNDTGDVDALYNPSGIGKGIKLIRAFAFPANQVLTAESYGVAATIAHTVYSDDTQELTNTANFVVELGDLVIADLDENGNVQYEDDNTTIKTKSLEDGETYIIYYYVVDKADNQLNTKVRTAKFIYDTTAPSFTVEGRSNVDSNPVVITYCEKATVTDVEVGATLTVNGEEVELTTTSAAGLGSYTIDKAGNYLVTVTDEAGNSTSKKFKVGAHDYIETRREVTCDEDGYEKTVCIVCGYVESEKTIESTGHDIVTVKIDATCTENGYSVSTCTVCGDENRYEFELDENGEFVLDNNGNKVPLFPALGHTYDEDENGKIIYTTVIEPTCMKKGRAEAVCTVCGEGKLIIELASDENAHEYSSAIKTLRPTCTEAGYTYKTCKYCGNIDKIDNLPATGHKETEWVVTTAATCGVDGVETLQCKKCKTLIGDFVIASVNFKDDVVDTTKYEVVLDEEGNQIFEIDSLGQKWYSCYELDETGDRIFEYETRAIPKTNKHTWNITTTDATTSAAGKTVYTCTVCGATKEVEIPKLVEYTVTFKSEDGKTELDKVTAYVGNTINFTGATPTKANSADGKYKYTFAGWVDENGKAVALPLEVTSNMTLKASFTQSTIIYTHKFMVPNTWTSTLETEAKTYNEFASLMGAIGDIRVPVATPVFALADPADDEELKKLYTFTFKGWENAEGVMVDDFTIADDATFYAVFEATPVGYEVIYYNGTSFVWKTTVNGGDPVVYGNYKKDAAGDNVHDEDGNPIIVYPTKDYDEEFHYTFKEWYSDATLKTEYKGEAITSLTRLYAGFTATAHIYDKTKGEVTQNATCTLPELTTYTCECGHKLTEQTAPENGHKWDGGVKDETTGITTYTCGVCGATKTDDVETYTVKFVNDNGLTIQTFGAVVHGTKVDFTAAEPTKASDKKNDYTFAGWVDVNGEKYTTAEVEALEITKDWVFEAYYTETAREYRVSYVDVNNKVVQTATGFHYGDKIPAFAGDITKITKNYDANFHYTFEKWSLSTSDTVTGDMVIAPVFAKVAHDYTETKENPATCDKVGGTVKVCSCGIEQAIGEVIAPLGHTDVKADGTKVKHTVVPATIYKEGSDSYVCTRCGQTITKTLAKLPSQKITITVFDKEGKPAANGAAEVTITNKANPNEKYTTNTDANGQAIFTVAAGQEWNVGITGKTLPDGGYGGTVGTDGNFTAGEESGSDSSGSNCSCSCHKNTFWGILFRFFHKFIKIFTGKIGCCSDPDPRY